MASKSLQFVLSAVDKSAGKVIGNVATQSEKSSHRISTAFSSVGNLIGGDVGDAFDKLSESADNFDGKGMANKLTAVGGAAMGVGAVLTSMGSSEQAASQQLAQAINNTGHSADQFEGQINAVVGQMEKFGHSAVDTKGALQVLTQSTHDPEKALSLMGEAADLAAAKHVSLQTASDQLARLLGGRGTRTLASYNIALVKNADGTTNWDKTNQALAATLSGQASAASNTLMGHFKALRTEVEDNVAEFGQKWGPAILATGTVMTAVGPVMKGAGALVKKMGAAFTAAGAENTAAAEEIAAGDAEIVASNDAAAASAGRMSTVMGRVKGSGLAGAIGITAVAVGGYEAGKGLAGMVEKGNLTAQMMDKLGGKLGDLQESLVNTTGDTADAGKAWLEAELQADGLGSRAAKSGITIDQMTTAIMGGKKSTDQLIDAWKRSGAPSDATIVAMGELAGGYRKTTDAQKKKTAAEKQDTSAADKQAAALSLQASKLGTTSTALKTAEAAAKKDALSGKANTLQMQLENDAAGLLSQGLDKLNGRTLDVEQANIAFKNKLHDASQALKDNGSSLSDNTQKGRNNRQMVLDSITAAQEHASAIAKQTGSTQHATAAYHDDIGALRQHLISLGYDKDAVQRIISKYAQMPRLVKTKVDVNDHASSKLIELQDYLNKLTDGTYTITVSANGNINVNGQNVHGHYAGGTNYAPGGMSIVGERGPEVLDLPRGSRIKQMSQVGRGGDTYNITIQTPQIWAGNSADLGRIVAGHLGQYAGRGGKIAISKALV